jgi:hypothetical protein
MPITDIGSYVPTGQSFEAYWTDVDADRVANTLPVLALPDGYSLATLTTDLAALQASITGMENIDNLQGIAMNGRDASRGTVRRSIINYRETVEFKLKGSVYSGNAPSTPQERTSEQKLLKAADDVENLWTLVDADSSVPNFTPPLVLRGGITLAAFTAKLVTLREKFKAVNTAENDGKIARTARDKLLLPFRDRLVEYREAVRVEYGEEHTFFISLPGVYPGPGSTPDGVTLSGQWDELTMEAALTWSPSSNANLSEYEVRVSSGATYDSGNSSIAGTIPAGGEEFRTIQELAQLGDTATFKVFVVLTTGNRAGSNTVTLTRP